MLQLAYRMLVPDGILFLAVRPKITFSLRIFLMNAIAPTSLRRQFSLLDI